MNSTGKVCPNDSRQPSNSASRNSKPSVVTRTGPIRPRIVQRVQVHRAGLPIVGISWKPPRLPPAGQSAAEHVYARCDQQKRPEAAEPDELEKPEVVEQQQRAEADQND